MADALDDTQATQAAAPRRWTGLVLLAVAVVAFGMVNNLNKLAYGYGPTVLTLLALRTWLIVVLLGGWLRATRQPLVLPRATWPRLAWLGLTFAVAAFLLLTAIRFIPVGLAVLAFYVFPIFVALLSAALGEMRLSPAVVGGLVIAFAGLGLAVDVSFAGELIWGVAIAIAAAIGIALNLVGSQRLMTSQPSMAVTFNMMLVGSVALTVGLALDGGPVWPATGEGWLVLASTAIVGPIALISIYAALRFVSSLTTAMVMNGEPILTVLFAVLLFGETLTLTQSVGAAMVIGAIIVVTRASAGKPA